MNLCAVIAIMIPLLMVAGWLHHIVFMWCGDIREWMNYCQQEWEVFDEAIMRLAKLENQTTHYTQEGQQELN